MPLSRQSSRPRSPEAAEFKSARSFGALGTEIYNSADHNVRSQSPPGLQSSASLRDLSLPGHLSNERILHRAARSNSPNNSRISNIKNDDSWFEVEGSSSHNKSFGSLALSPERIPNARLGSEVPLAHTSVFGSSQLSGCQGDFCEFNLHTWEPKTISRPKSKQQQVQSSKGDYRKALYKAGLLEHSIDDSVAGHDMMRIGYHSILLARQQAPLVKLFLERHMRGDDAPLVLQDNYMDFA
eukprot:gene44437-54343_t